MVYLVPLIAMLLGALLASKLWVGDIAAMLGAASGFIFGLLMVRYYSVAHRDNPEMQPVLSSTGSPQNVKFVEV